MRQDHNGFTLLELAVVTIIVAVLFTIALNRMLELMVDAERVNLLQVEGRIKSALGLELSRRVVEKDLDSIGDLAGVNPMELLHEVPHDYQGEREHANLEILPAGAWVFDTTRKVLIYTINNTDQFRSDLPGRPRAEYRLELNYDDNNQNGRFDVKIDRLSGLKLASVGNYHWLEKSD